MFKNINDILGRISEKNRDIAGVLEEIFGTLKEIAVEVEPMRTDRGGFDEQISNRKKINLNKDFGKAVDIVADKIGNINMIPGVPGNCYPLCISKAFGKWNSRKYGFKGIAERTIDYWLTCSKVNRDTIIFTNAWDEIDFNQNFRKRFDSQTSNSDKTVCVILATSQGFSIQYIR